MVISISPADIAGMSPGRRRRVAELEARIAALGQPIVFASNQARRSTRPASIGLMHRVPRVEQRVGGLSAEVRLLRAEIEKQGSSTRLASMDLMHRVTSVEERVRGLEAEVIRCHTCIDRLRADLQEDIKIRKSQVAL